MNDPAREATESFSLLAPSDASIESDWQIAPEAIRDLGLAAIVTAMCPHKPHQEAVKNVFYRMCADPEVIRYRQAVLDDLRRLPALADALRALLPSLDELAQFAQHRPIAETSLHEVARRAGELELLVGCIHGLSQAFAAAGEGVRSVGLLRLRNYVAARAADPGFRHMVAALPELLADLRRSASITIGVNLDEYLRPEEAILLAVNDTRFTASGLLSRLFGKRGAEGKGIGPLHTLPLISEGQGMIVGAGTLPAGATKRAEPLMVPLFRDLAAVLDKVARPIAHELRRYVQISSKVLVGLRTEIIFYVSALELARKLDSRGLPLCRPEIAPAEERICEVEDSYNVQLALHLGNLSPAGSVADRVIANDIILGTRGRIVILTGPNQGGKTTYMQAVGQTQVLAQAGLLVPGRHARISLVDGIFTHFPVEERLELGTGRFGDEARRTKAIFDQVTRHSLVLLNETFSTTNAGESLYLARDIVRVLRLVGLRAVYTTHLHELAARAGELNAETPGESQVVSMVASPAGVNGEHMALQAGESPRSYRIGVGPPTGRSYAEQIAERYGIGFEQLLSLLHERHVLAQDDGSL